MIDRAHDVAPETDELGFDFRTQLRSLTSPYEPIGPYINLSVSGRANLRQIKLLSSLLELLDGVAVTYFEHGAGI